jgi:hypothetical protein
MDARSANASEGDSERRDAPAHLPSSPRVEQGTHEEEGRHGGHDRDDDDGELAGRIASAFGGSLDRALLTVAERTLSVGTGRKAVARALHGSQV